MSRPTDLTTALATMRRGDAPALSWLAHCPFLGAADLATLLAAEEPSSVYRRLRSFTERGLVEHVVPSSSVLHPQRLFYLSDPGVRVAAHLAGEPATGFACRLGIGEAGLLQRLVRLEHLVHARGVLIDLLAALRTTKYAGPQDAGARLEAWRPWPVRQAYTWRGQRLSLTADGAGTLVVRRRGAVLQAPFVLLWDGGAVPVEALRSRVRALVRARDAPERWRGDAPPFPTVLLVGASDERAEEARGLALDVARQEGTRALTLVATSVPLLWEEGPLASIWRREDGCVDALLTALPLSRPPRNDPEPAPFSSHGCVEHQDGRHAVLVRGGFVFRARALPRAEAPTGVSLLSLGLLPREVRALHCIAVQPLLTAAIIAELTGDRPRGTATTLRRLERAGLVAWDLPAPYELPRLRRYFLTPGGLRLLAQRAGLTPTDYARATGSIAGFLVARSRQEDRGDRRFPRKAVLGGHRLAWLQRYLPHTCAVQEVFLGFVRAARAAQGLDHELEVWQGDWACARRYTDDGVWHTLRPDALGRYRVGDQALTFFVEIDRGTCTLRRHLHAKLAAYVAYRDSGAWAHGVRAELVFPTLLVVTTTQGRLCHVLDLAIAVASARLTRPLALLVTTAEDLATRGPLGPIWRDAVQAPPRALYSIVEYPDQVWSATLARTPPSTDPPPRGGVQVAAGVAAKEPLAFTESIRLMNRR